MTVSTVVAAGFLVVVAGIVIWMLWSLITGGPSLRRGSGNPGIPSHHSSMSVGSNCDADGSSGGDGGGGGS
ncbi:hypothetical protein [Streptosporangium roseum]|uniref:hypothetical protein n=1 Tax=Streptosporangium roseum TaxID=2001 RepID=UPI0012DDD4D0|nr:hypothetical protein [Streptosporangium roseum]